MSRARSNHDMVYRPCQIPEKLLQKLRIVGIDRNGLLCVDQPRSFLEPLRIATCQDHIDALGTRSPAGLQTNAGAAADDDNGLAQQVRPPPSSDSPRWPPHRAPVARRA